MVSIQTNLQQWRRWDEGVMVITPEFDMLLSKQGHPNAGRH